ncbi:hypothetical protein GWK47_050652 [Chionoecetes opilio]|uniref:Uncharacterized protein n=1 Tax=Chionoecetes opilio TaxID=41210 RepID=A0A8J4Y9U0_CHIOP|nr:hypothetical protein GWK47_050652 [Chionoecetes opilio]
MNLLSSPYAAGIKGLLACLDTKTLHALAATATNNRILPDSNEEAAKVILAFTESIGRLFSYRRLTTRVLFDYLHTRGAAVRVADSKAELIEKVKKEWEESYGDQKPTAARKKVRAQATPPPPPQPTLPTINTTLNVNLTLQMNPTTTPPLTTKLQVLEVTYLSVNSAHGFT